VLLLVVVIVAASGTAYGRHQDRRADVAASLATAKAGVDAAGAAPDAGAADASLTRAQAALDRARRAGAATTLLASWQQDVDTARDELHGIRRLTDVTKVGDLPPSLAAQPVRLARSGREVYVVASDLYEVDVAGRRLVRLLTNGETVAGRPLGSLQDAAVDGHGLAVTDGARLYRRDPSGRWRASPLGLLENGQPWPAGAAGVFQGSLYLLHPTTGQILKFAADALETLPDAWASDDSTKDLAGARDLTVDGDIYVLLADGRVLAFHRGAPRGTLADQVRPALTNPVALFGQADTRYLYVAEAGPDGGRIVRLDRDGGNVEQWLPPVSGDPALANALAEMRDVVVDEAAGVLYVVTGDALWRIALPTPGMIVER
jgi:DNA-binding beta-propeller fold protein YncE